MLSLIKVQGDSMLPKLANDDFVVVSRFFWSLRPGDLVVADHDRYNKIIKRIEQVSEEKGYLLTGENEASVSSEDMGWISKQQIFGKVILQIKR
ncbi:hypothetical protein A9Q78_01090 [Methylophaga sp. 41_12_T18]|nr:hypothetical protein A9Q78_01090 [Methylophaga sp. 41_12_T18]